MEASRALVVYYSRTGTTATLAQSIAKTIGADLEPLVDTVVRSGPLGYLRSLGDAMGRRRTTLRPLRVDPADYDLVVIGTPVWGDAVSAPVRAFLEDHRGRLPAVAFFVTDKANDHEAVFREMSSLAGKAPVAQFGVPRNDVVGGRYAGRTGVFVRSLPPTVRRASQRPAPLTPPGAGRPPTGRVALGR